MQIPLRSLEHQTGQRLQTVHSFSDETCLDKLPGTCGYSSGKGTKHKHEHNVCAETISQLIQYHLCFVKKKKKNIMKNRHKH